MKKQFLSLEERNKLINNEKKMKEMKEKDIKRKVFVIRFFYFSQIAFWVFVMILILLKK